MADEDQELYHAARMLLKQLGGPSDKFIVSVIDTMSNDGTPYQSIVLHGYWEEIEKLNVPKEFMGYEVSYAPMDEAMGT